MKRQTARPPRPQSRAKAKRGPSRETSAPLNLGLEGARLAALLGLIVLVWCVIYNRTSVAAWRVPLEYGVEPELSDAKGVLSTIKAAMDGEFIPFLPKYVHQLGAPYVANWNEVPIIEQFLFFGAGMLARVVGLFAAANAAVLIAQMLAGAAFYTSCRMLRCAWQWAFAGALVFAFSRYAAARSLHHILQTYYWHVPLFLLVCKWMTTGSGLRFRTRRYYFAVAVAVITGVQDVYLTNNFVQLAALACLVQWFRHGWRAMIVPATVIAAAVLALFSMDANVMVYHFLHGPNADVLARNFKWLEFYGLKITDLFIPPPDHRFPPLADLGASYFPQTLIPGEIPPSCYLGLLGIAALLWMVAEAFARVMRRPPRPLPMEVLQIGWTTAYSVVGGFNSILGILGVQLFRSTNRSSIVILGIVLLFAIQRLSVLSRNWRPASLYGIPFALALLALWDQLPPQTSDAAIARTAEIVDSDRAFTAKMEKRLPDGAMVFQIPVMQFPESPAPGMNAYEHLRPSFYSEHLRFSFGSMKGRPREQWQQALTGLSIPEVARALESYGFSAIYIDRRGFPDKGARIIDELKAAGHNEIIEDSIGELVCIPLNPSPHPVQPFLP